MQRMQKVRNKHKYASNAAVTAGKLRG